MSSPADVETPKKSIAEGPAFVASITAAAIVLHAWLAWGYRALFLGNAVDDAYISFRYLDNLVAGRGLVYNAGERVEGFSNLLWILLLAPLRLAGADVVLASQLVGIGFGAAAIGLAVLGARRLLGVRSLVGTAFVALVPATSGYFAAWSVGGLEGSLFAFLLVAAWFRYHVEALSPGKRPLSALLFLALAMTRPEGIFLSLLAAGWHVTRAFVEGRPLFSPEGRRFLIWLGLSLLAFELFRFSYYGPHLFPNAVRAKVGAGLASFERGLAYVHEHFASPYLLLCMPIVLFGRIRKSPALSAAAALVCFQVVLVVVVGGDWSVGRFFAPLLPLGAAAVAGAGAEVARSSEVFHEKVSRLGVVLAALVWLGFAAYVTGPLGEARFFGSFAPYDAERLLIGRWLRDKAPKNAKIAVYAAGEIPWASGLYAHDMLGLNDAHIASIEVSSMGKGIAGHEKYDPDYTLRVVKPDVIIDAHLVPGLREHPDFARYELVPGFRYNGFFVTQEMAEILAEPPTAGASPKP